MSEQEQNNVGEQPVQQTEESAPLEEQPVQQEIQQAPPQEQQAQPEQAQPDQAQDDAGSHIKPHGIIKHDLCVKNFDYSTTEADVKKLIEEYGEIESMHYPVFPDTQNFRGLVFVTMKDPAAKDRMLSELNGRTYGNRQIRVDISFGSSRHTQSSGPTKDVFCGGWNTEKTTEEDLRKVFQDCGTITEVRIPRNTFDGKPRGFAFVSFADIEGVNNALKKEGTMLHGRALIVNEENRGRRSRVGGDRYGRGSFRHNPYGRRDRMGYGGYQRGGYQDRGYGGYQRGGYQDRGGYQQQQYQQPRGGYQDRGYAQQRDYQQRDYQQRDYQPQPQQQAYAQQSYNGGERYDRGYQSRGGEYQQTARGYDQQQQGYQQQAQPTRGYDQQQQQGGYQQQAQQQGYDQQTYQQTNRAYAKDSYAQQQGGYQQQAQQQTRGYDQQSYQQQGGYNQQGYR